jgi:hypothetical protein
MSVRTNRLSSPRTPSTGMLKCPSALLVTARECPSASRRKSNLSLPIIGNEADTVPMPPLRATIRRSVAAGWDRASLVLAGRVQRIAITQMQTDLWKITCEEHLYPGLWQRWFRSQCVSVGWPPGAGFHLEGSGKRSFGWTIARNALARIKPGDHIFVTLRGSRVARLGTVTELAVRDSEWNPFIPRSKTEKYGEPGRRIHLKWNLELGPDDREYVVALPDGVRLSGAQLRTTLSVVKSISLAQLESILADHTNWVRLWANFDYERALSGYIAAFPHRLEDGLLPYPLEKTRERLGVGRTRMDVLLMDESGTPVVVECKQDAPTLSHLRQLRAYMAHVARDVGKAPRGILVHGGARKLRSEVRIEADKRPRIELIQHNLDVVFSRST